MELLLISLAVSATSVTVTRAAIFQWLRERTAWKLLQCPYCFSHWLALLAVAAYRPSWWLPIETLAVVAGAGAWSILLVHLLERTDH